MDTATGDAIMGALLRIKTHRSLHFLAAELRLRLRRLSFLLLSPIHFSLALSHLRSLPLHSKTILLARLLLRSLSLLFSPLHRIHCLRLRDFDAAILLLAMCDAYNPSAASTEHRSIDWRSLIARRFSGAALTTAGLGGGLWPVLLPHVDAAAKCHRLVQAARPAAHSTRSAAAAVAVTSLAVAEDGECAICQERIAVGVAMPCGHPFHWKCILEWLRMRNTCPFCRYQLPTDDVYTEIERVWSIAMKVPTIDQLNLR